MTSFFTAPLPAVSGFNTFIVLGSLWGLVACWLVLINLVTFFIFGLDKYKAKRKVHRETTRRIPEKTLFLLSGVGGSMGALLGMRVFHHKTLHKSFRFGIPAILAAHIVILLGLWIFFNK